MEKFKQITLMIILVILNLCTFSQNPSKFQLAENLSKVSLYPVDDKGVLLFELIYMSRKDQELKITLLDNEYEQKWSQKFDHVGFTMDRILLSEDKKKVFVAYYSDSKKNQWSHRVLYNEKIRVIAIGLDDGSKEILDAEIPSNATLRDFGSTDEMIYAVFSDKGAFKNKSYAIIKTIESKQNHIVEIGEDVKLIDYIGSYTNIKDDGIYTMISYKDKAKDFVGCEIDHINADGQLVKKSKTALSEEKEWPFDCIAFHGDNSVQLFGYDMLTNAMTMDMVEPASSFAMLKIENNKVSSFSTTGFGELKHPMISIDDNLIGGLIESKIKENKAKKGKLNQAFNIVAHPTIKSGDLYYSFFESYAPIYEVTTTKSPSGMSTSQSKKYSESFFPHLQIACFDAEGNLKWDNNCKLKKFTREKGNANSTWQVNEDGTVSAVTHTNNYQIFLYKAQNGNTIKEEKSTFRDILTESEWKDMVASQAILLSGSQYPFSVVAIPFSTGDSKWKVCYIAQKDKKSPYFLMFKSYKF